MRKAAAAALLCLLLVPVLRAADPGGSGAQNETELEDLVRKDRNAVRRARYALKKARREGDDAAAEEATKRLYRTKQRYQRSRGELRALIKSGRVSPRYKKLKRLIREDRNALRRLRRRLKKAERSGDGEAASRVREKIQKAKRRLKKRRLALRRYLSDFGMPAKTRGGDGYRKGRRKDGRKDGRRARKRRGQSGGGRAPGD